MLSIDSCVTSSLHCDLFLPVSEKRQHFIPNTPQFIFISSGDAVCAFTTTFLQCHFMEGELSTCRAKSKEFTWSPASLPVDAFPLESSRPQDWDIKSADFLEQKRNKTGLVVLITLRHAARSLLCIFSDITAGKCNRAICMHGRANLVHVISPNLNLSSFPKSAGVFSENVFAGVVAVGFERGIIGILDLCLDWHVSAGSIHAPEPAVATPLTECQQVFSDNDRLSPFSSMMEHSLICLNNSHLSSRSFYYSNPRDRIISKIPFSSVRVTMLHSIRAIKSLVVGFNFGGWQIWRLTDLKLIYAFQELPSPWSLGPVVNCAFSEPSDDPRYCCFLWIGWQTPDIATSPSDLLPRLSCPQTTPKASLFQMGFKERTEHYQSITDSTVYEYDEFSGASERLTTKLSTSSANDIGNGGSPFVGKLTSIQSLSTNYITNFNLCSNRLTALVWQASQHSVGIGLFDLDRWYHAQMPAQIRPDNSFFAVYNTSLGLPQSSTLTAFILPHTVLAFWAKKQKRELYASRLCDSRLNKSTGLFKADKLSIFSTSRFRKPLPEVQLRPSVHGFQALVPFLGKDAGACATLRFVSRQELCLRELITAQRNPEIDFKLNEWIIEAVACGLTRELEGVCANVDRIFDANGYLLSGIQLALGVDDLPPGLLDEIEVDEMEDAEDDDSLTGINGRRGKRGASLQQLRPSKRQKRGEKSGTSLCDLASSWVVIANCLFENDMMHQLKNLSEFIGRVTEDEETGVIFIHDWVWLCWLGRKTVFDNLCAPIFSSNNYGYPEPSLFADTLKEIGICAQELDKLSNLAKYVYKKQPTGSSLSRLLIITTYAEYTRPVCFLLRLGLLSQRHEETNEKNTKTSLLRLPTYSSAKVVSFLESISQRYPSSEAEISPLSNRLLRYLLGQEEYESEGSGSAWSIWVDQENQPMAVTYPPQRLQSVCALWQMMPDEEKCPARLGLLVLLLFDVIGAQASLMEAAVNDAATTKKGRGSSDQLRVLFNKQVVQNDKKQAVSPRKWADKMRQRVIDQVVREFPYAKRLLPSIQVLWLIDRCRFEEVLHFRKSGGHPLAKLPELFPGQAKQAASICVRFGHSEVAALFGRHANLESESGTLSTVAPVSGSPLLALYRARRLYANKSAAEASQIFIQIASAFRKSGRFLDFINLGLTNWESDLLFTQLRKEGRRELLFACLAARAQFKEAVDILSNDAYGCLQNQLIGSDTTTLSKLMLETIQSCLPIEHLCNDHLQFRPPPIRSVGEVETEDEAPTGISGDTNERPVFQVQLIDDTSATAALPARLRASKTPRTSRLRVEPTTVARAHSSAYWQQFHEIRRGSFNAASEFPSGSVRKPIITPNSRRFRRKIYRMMYTKSVDSQANVGLSRQTLVKPRMPNFEGVAEEGLPGSDGKATDSRPSVMDETRVDFWSEVGRWHKERVADKPKPTPILKKPSIAPSTDKTPHGEALNASGEISFQDCEEADPSLEADAEVTINPHTMRLGGLVSLHNEGSILLEDEVKLELNSAISACDNASKQFPQSFSTFSPPIKVVRPANFKGDVVADALCSGLGNFVFSFPFSAFDGMQQAPFTPQETVIEEDEDVEEEGADSEESDHFEDNLSKSVSLLDNHDVSSENIVPSCSLDGGEMAMPDEAGVIYESDNENAASEQEEQATGDVPTDGSKQVALVVEEQEESVESEEFESFTPRRSHRQIKKPIRYEAK